MKKLFLFMTLLSAFMGCARSVSESAPISPSDMGARQVAALWTPADGSPEEMETFIRDNRCSDDSARDALYQSLSRIFEQLYMHADMLTVDLLSPTTLITPTFPTLADEIMAAYSPTAHLYEDLFANKIAFLTILNFPHYTLAQKDSLGRTWTRRQWGYARMGDIFTDRVPASVAKQLAQAQADAEAYIADYNIHTSILRTEDDRALWDEDLCLLSHWNLRDELKADYRCQEKQEMIYQIMQRIVSQDIPACVIHSTEYLWYPYSNRVFKDGIEVSAPREADVRYERILQHFHAYIAQDPYCPQMPTAIQRNFEGGMEMPAQQVQQLFEDYISSPSVQRTAAVIRQRLGRDLRPYDIWYDGFKSRSNFNEDHLTALTRARYPHAKAYEKDIPRLLQNLGFAPTTANEIASHIVVEPARGSGHAWPTLGHGEPARLRTRIGAKGMDYKGYNIAVHEMGHNVEEVVTLYGMDEYLLSGIPNTGFTEASAFLFQNRDLQLLGYPVQPADSDAVYDQIWSTYEIMGVSLVDMGMWQWLYAHPKANAMELKQATLSIAQSVWNTYYAPLFGEKNCILLGVYSHMVNSPMYLPNYPIGELVKAQLEEHLQGLAPAEWAQEYLRIYRQGRLTPNLWLEGIKNF